MTDARLLAKAAGAAMRAYEPVTHLVAITEQIGGDIGQCGNAVIEFLDLLRFYVREETLRGLVVPQATTKRPKARAVATSVLAQAKGGHARAAKLSPARRKAIAKVAAEVRWKGKRKGR